MFDIFLILLGFELFLADPATAVYVAVRKLVGLQLFCFFRTRKVEVAEPC